MPAAAPSARITGIYRYPVKGLTPEHLARAELSPGQTLLGDRRYAIENGPSGFNPAEPKWLPKPHFLMLMRDEWLAGLRTRFDDASNVLVINYNGRIVAQGNLATPEGRVTIENFFASTFPNLISAYQSMGVKFENTQQANLPYDQVHSTWRDFGPRAGFAYRAFDGRSSFVIRGGYSISYFPLALVQWIDNNRQNFPLSQGYSYNPDNTAQTYLNDGLPNYMARSVPTVIAGLNTANIVSLAQVTGVTPGNNQLTYFSPNQPDSLTHTWNLTLEKEISANTVVRVRYIGSHSANLSQNYNYNSATPAYIWYATTGLPVPTGATSNIATRPFDSTSGIGNIQEFMRTGWANANGFEAEVQRRFSKGIAYQWSYTMMNAFSTATAVLAPNQYLSGLVPSDYDARNALLN